MHVVEVSFKSILNKSILSKVLTNEDDISFKAMHVVEVPFKSILNK